MKRTSLYPDDTKLAEAMTATALGTTAPKSSAILRVAMLLDLPIVSIRTASKTLPSDIMI